MAKTATDVGVIVNGAQKVLDAVNDMSGIAKQLGSVANVATLAIAVTAIIENVLARAKDLKVAMTTQDEAKLRAMLDELKSANDRLAGNIAAS
jgi:hypothetical protein